MNTNQLPVIAHSVPSVLGLSSIKRRIDPIDVPPRPLGSKRSALASKRANAAASTGGRNAVLVAAGAKLLASGDGTVTFLLHSSDYGLLMERTQRQGLGMRLVQTIMFADAKSFDHWCAVEPLRFDDGLLFSRLVREGHAAFANRR